MRAFLDTNVLITGGYTVRPGIDEVAVTSLSLAELAFGVAAAPSAEQRAIRVTELNRIRSVFGRGAPFDDDAAMSYGIITDLVLARGRSVRGRVMDLMIAAIAHSHGAALVTANTADFAGLEPVLTVLPA